MQAAKKAVETIKETATNIGASAKSGLEKTKATVQEKSERMSARDPMQKDMATQKKEERINLAEMEKQEAREHNVAAKQSAMARPMKEGHYTTTGSETEASAAAYSTIGAYGPGQPMGTNQMSAMPAHGHGLRLRHEELTDDVVGSHPVGTNTGMGTTTAHNVPLTDDVVGSHPMGTTTAHNVALTDNVMGSHPIGTNNGMTSTTAHNVPVRGSGTAPGSGPNFS